ncbi:MAG: (Fe-S)-binding protein [Syntrophorhabdaceae bacterium]|nr:(Fe-S)-binding protein [Syntrophorhabdaceae bacterium]
MDTIAIEPFKIVTEGLKEVGGGTYRLCYQCGRCETVCPWNRVRSFFVRRMNNQAQIGLVPFESEDLWLCTTCESCMERCPRGVLTISNMVAMRRLLLPDGVVPASIPSLRTATTNIASVGNPWGLRQEERAQWAFGLEIKEFDENTEFLYFPGCYLSYDPRLKKVAQATAKILKKAGVDFGILGPKESCCGESIRKTGNEILFKRIARENIKVFIDSGVKKIITSSPHCYHTFKNEYPEFKMNFDVIHISELLFELIKEGRLRVNREFEKRVAYHDPCYLGRHNGIYEEPRGILKKAGIQLIELPEMRDESLCCGMGGGRIWMETKKEERFSNIRIKQVMEIEAEVLATFCPYCITAFEDSRLVMGLRDKLEVKDVTEILEEVI